MHTIIGREPSNSANIKMLQIVLDLENSRTFLIAGNYDTKVIRKPLNSFPTKPQSILDMARSFDKIQQRLTMD